MCHTRTATRPLHYEPNIDAVNVSMCPMASREGDCAPYNQARTQDTRLSNNPAPIFSGESADMVQCPEAARVQYEGEAVVSSIN